MAWLGALVDDVAARLVEAATEGRAGPSEGGDR